MSSPGDDGSASVEPVVVALRIDQDVTRARHRVRDAATMLKMDLVTQTKVITAASELARNTVLYGNGGELEISVVVDFDARSRQRRGLQLLFTDSGPGIADIEKAMTSGWTSGAGLGLGLPGSRSLVNEFELTSSPGDGTRIRLVMWVRER